MTRVDAVLRWFGEGKPRRRDLRPSDGTKNTWPRGSGQVSDVWKPVRRTIGGASKWDGRRS